MSRIPQLRKLLATEPNPDIRAGYKREIAALTDTSRSAMKKRGAHLAQTMKKSELPWVNLDDDYPVVMGDDGTWKYVAAGDEGGSPYFVGFDDHTTSGVIVYAGDEEAAEEIAAEAILAANPNYFQDENSFMEENGVDPNTIDWDKTSNDEIVNQHGGTIIYINGAGYVSTTGSPTVRRLKRPTPPKSAVDALAKVKAAATEFSTKYADQLKGNIVGTSYLGRDLRYFLGTQGKDERDELIHSLESSIAFEQKYQDDPAEAGPSDFLPDAQALLSALKAFRFPSEGATKAARPAMRKASDDPVFDALFDKYWAKDYWEWGEKASDENVRERERAKSKAMVDKVRNELTTGNVTEYARSLVRTSQVFTRAYLAQKDGAPAKGGVDEVLSFYAKKFPAKAARPGMRKAGSLDTFTFDELDPADQKAAIESVRRNQGENWDWRSVMGYDEGLYTNLKEKFGITAEWDNLEFDHLQRYGNFPGATISRDFIMQSAGIQDVAYDGGEKITDSMPSEIRIDRKGSLNEDDLPTVVEWDSADGKFYQAFTEAGRDILHNAGQWLADYAANEAEYRESDEAIKEDIEANAMIFLEDGSLAPQPRSRRKAARPAMRKAAPGKVGDEIGVDQVPDEAQFVSDSQDADAIKESLGPDAQGYDSFFVIVGDGDYEAVWGMYGIVPYNNKQVTRLV